jgi:hypothetical protein
MSSHHFSTKTIGDIETLLPGFKAVWASIKAECNTRQRCPKSVTFSDVPQDVCADDHDCARRFKLNLETMRLEGSVHVSAGEWAVHAGKNHDGAVSDIPGNMALVTCTWNDFHRSFSMTIQVKSLPAQVTARASV